jgi:uncharacterized protein (DUF2384 family)
MTPADAIEVLDALERALHADGFESVVSVLETLIGAIGDDNRILAWLRAPHPDLGGRRPIEVIREGHAEIVADMLEATKMGLTS